MLRSPDIAADLERRGRNIAAAAGPGVEVSTFVGVNRVRITIRTATLDARIRQAKTKSLTRAIDAGR
jgi:hypothetical protein